MTPGLSVRGLFVRRGPFALGPVETEVAPGEVLALLGPTGAGKTTLLRLLAGFLPPGAGSVSLQGRDLHDLPPEDRRVGYVPQGPSLFPHRTALGNVRYPLDLQGRRDARVAAEGWLRRMEVEHRSGVRPVHLSGGEAQRVAFARALASEPEWLLFDEPLSAVDVQGKEVLLRVLREVVEGRGLPAIVVTHDPETAFTVADRFLALEGGRVVFQGTAETLVDSPPSEFLSRFVGYENVLSGAELASAPASSLGAWLRERAGGGGVAWPAEAGSLNVEASPGRWPFVLEKVKPLPSGWMLLGRSGGLTVRVEAPRSSDSSWGGRQSGPLFLSLDPERVHPLPSATEAGAEAHDPRP